MGSGVDTMVGTATGTVEADDDFFCTLRGTTVGAVLEEAWALSGGGAGVGSESPRTGLCGLLPLTLGVGFES